MFTRKPIQPTLLKDAYKIGHPAQYPKNTTMVVSNITPRGTRRSPSPLGVIGWAYQYLIQEYFIDQFNQNFFWRDKDTVIKAYKRRVDNMLGPGTNVDHIADLHDLGYLPLHVKAVPEGTLVPYRVPTLTIRNTLPEFYWLTNMPETLMSNVLWLPSTSATTAFMYRKNFDKHARETGGDLSFVQWQGHDFSMRGMSGIEAAVLSGAGHLLCFTGTDTIPAIDFFETYYGANSDTELIGGSVPATEHSVMCIGGKEGEWETIDRIAFEVYPKNTVSVVWDTYDFWKGVTEYLPSRKDRILAREGKIVIRPDSGDPVKILCGDPDAGKTEAERKGLVHCLWDIFSGTVNSECFRILDPHIGCIYGDSITLERQTEILDRLKAKGFWFNGVLGIGSFTYQHVTRDTDGWAMKATYAELDGVGHTIYKEPKTDSGLKNSARGLLKVDLDPLGKIYLREDVDWNTESTGLLQTIFKDGVRDNIQTLSQVRKRVASYL